MSGQSSALGRRLGALSLAAATSFAATFALTPSPIFAAEGPGEDDLVEVVIDADTCDESVSLVTDPTTGAIYLNRNGEWFEIEDHYLSVGIETVQSVPVSFGLIGRSSGWEVHLKIHHSADNIEWVVLDTNPTGEVSFTLSAPTDDSNFPAIEVFYTSPGVALPTVPDVVIQPVPTCPGTADGPIDEGKGNKG
ncbi:hypothetical protein G6O69_29265 [Pseudenhygromyxa sp. WMMC2535]|uniref:hypothetical protein n=1 Tax=Pseudenhygromyxa sp. WMMC2535 TaxID=2712867 RepID=UPI001556AB90|nr:hypothetical protein [Pseudenhygromyxa sp. WMMC2535]NVB41954.1 hypothetical protein [Pseudenhygromyxa sp. WMMC2535]